VTLQSGVLALWSYHLAPIPAQICNKDNTSALCVYWHAAHRVNDSTFAITMGTDFVAGLVVIGQGAMVLN